MDWKKFTGGYLLVSFLLALPFTILFLGWVLRGFKHSQIHPGILSIELLLPAVLFLMVYIIFIFFRNKKVSLTAVKFLIILQVVWVIAQVFIPIFSSTMG